MLSDGLKELRNLADELYEEVDSEILDEENKARLQGILDNISNDVAWALDVLLPYE